MNQPSDKPNHEEASANRIGAGLLSWHCGIGPLDDPVGNMLFSVRIIVEILLLLAFSRTYKRNE